MIKFINNLTKFFFIFIAKFNLMIIKNLQIFKTRFLKYIYYDY